MSRVIDERAYLRTVRLPSGEVRLDVRHGVVGEWQAMQVFTDRIADGMMEFFEQAYDLTMETLGDELRRYELIAAARDTLERQADQVRRLYRALTDC